MLLAAGAVLGPYEILAPLGAGGMGEVYRARDTRLGRDVAVKVLPRHLGDSAEVRARFEREARTISSLNHPHICVLHDVGRAGDTDYLVMELVEGETLADRLQRGALPAAEVLKLGAQIADALDRAHRAGVIHRDLKPGNIMLTRSGAKLMDFGLARVTGMAGPAGGSGVTVGALSQSPTIAQPLTAEGTIVGTFQYLSPEQLEGREADARADLWALGCVLYEMATGRRAFEGKSQASLIGAIMHTQPAPVSQIAPMSPLALERLVAACLAKDPADRIQSAHDVKLQLGWMGEGAVSASGIAVPVQTKVRGRPRWLGVALVAAAAAAITALAMAFVPRGRTMAARESSVQRYVIGNADLQSSATPAISPDGSYVVFSVREGANRQLYRRNLSSFAITPIAGTEDGTAPFFSPDGAWIGFVTSDAIKKVPVNGGLAQVIAAEPRPASGDWGRDGMIYFTSRGGGRDGLTALARVPATGGKVEVVAKLDTTAAEVETWMPDILPDGKTVLITVTGGGTSGWRIVAVHPDGTRQDVVQNGGICRYVHGHLLYYDFDSQAVLAVPFDVAKVRTSGTAVPLTEQVDGNYCFDASGTRLVYVPQPGAGEGSEIAWLDRKGAATLATETRDTWQQPRISPDGRRVVVRKSATNCELWILDAQSKSLARVAHGDDHHNAIWSPDGRRIVYRRNSPPVAMIALTVAGAREVTTLAEGAAATGQPQAWSAGGNLLVYTMPGRTTASDIWVRPMDGGAPPAPFLASAAAEETPSISADGRWIAYVSNETGSTEVFVRPYPDDGTAWQISAGGGSSPLWSRDGRELFFVAGNKMMAAAIETRPAFRAGTPVMLFEGGFNSARIRDFDVAPDGRFVVIRRPAGSSGLPELRMLVNWEQEMQRVAGAAK